ncbi:MAG: molecular chaperone DnaJ [Deltaproteobacteria bacterium]|nr:MAG: molecular chaperone DnaJ [Deltaproteobacteria bacterium]
MLAGFEKRVEEKIRQAQKDGVFDQLEGRGKPLPPDELDGVAGDLRMAYRILKNAGMVPPEIEARKEIRNMAALLNRETDVASRYRITKRLNYLIWKMNVTSPESVMGLEIPEQYETGLLERMDRASASDDVSS